MKPPVGKEPMKGTEAKNRLAEHIQRVVAQAPPLSAEQLDHLAVLLRGAVDTR